MLSSDSTTGLLQGRDPQEGWTPQEEPIWKTYLPRNLEWSTETNLPARNHQSRSRKHRLVVVRSVSGKTPICSRMQCASDQIDLLLSLSLDMSHQNEVQVSCATSENKRMIPCHSASNCNSMLRHLHYSHHRDPHHHPYPSHRHNHLKHNLRESIRQCILPYPHPSHQHQLQETSTPLLRTFLSSCLP